MPWVRFDDIYPLHRKVRGLSDAAFRLHTEAIFWCARNLTDGHVPAEDVCDVSAVRRPLKYVPELVARGSWHEAGQACESEQCPAHVDNPPAAVDNGWLIHDYFDYQPSKQKVQKERKAKAQRQQRWLDKRKRGRDASQDASIDASADAAPPRPEGSGGGRRPRASGATGRSGQSPAVRAVPDWCGECDERTRQIETADGRPMRCRACHWLRDEEAS